MFLLIIALLLLAAASLLPDRPPINDIVGIAGVVCGVIGLVLIATNTVVVL